MMKTESLKISEFTDYCIISLLLIGTIHEGKYFKRMVVPINILSCLNVTAIYYVFFSSFFIQSMYQLIAQ